MPTVFILGAVMGSNLSSSSSGTPVDEGMRQHLFKHLNVVFKGYPQLRQFMLIPARVALQVVQQMQQQQTNQFNLMMGLVQQIQGHSNPGSNPPPPPPPPPASDPGGPAADEPDYAWQGVRMCARCGQRSYLREGVCFNLECVSWLHLFRRAS